MDAFERTGAPVVVLEAAGFEGFSVPDDLSVIGFDDLEVAPYVAAIRGEDSRPHEERFELQLKVRRTTAQPRIQAN